MFKSSSFLLVKSVWFGMGREGYGSRNNMKKGRVLIIRKNKKKGREKGIISKREW